LAIRAAEQRGIDLLKPEYNQLTAGSSQGNIHSAETRAPISQGRQGKPRDARWELK